MYIDNINSPWSEPGIVHRSPVSGFSMIWDVKIASLWKIFSRNWDAEAY